MSLLMDVAMIAPRSLIGFLVRSAATWRFRGCRPIRPCPARTPRCRPGPQRSGRCPGRILLGPGWPGGVGGDDHLVRVVGGLDVLQAVVGAGREHRAGRSRGFFEVVVVVGCTASMRGRNRRRLGADLAPTW